MKRGFDKLTDRQRQVIRLLQYNSGSKVAEMLGVSRQYVSWIKLEWESTEDKDKIMRTSFDGLESWEVEDVGCPDGEYPSCLNCPLVKCKYEE